MVRAHVLSHVRKFYAETMRAKKHPEYTKGFLFEVSRTEQSDPDKELFAER